MSEHLSKGNPGKSRGEPDKYFRLIPIPPRIRYLFSVIFMFGLGFIAALYGIKVLTFTIIALAIFATVILLFKKPKMGIYLSMALSFFIATLNRFMYPMPYGFGVEITLFLVYIILFLKYFKSLNFSLANNKIVFLVFIWFLYVILQITNPQSNSIEAWVYAMRGVGLIQLLIIPLIFVLFTTKKDLKNFLIFYFSISLLGILWAVKQQWLGLTEAEKNYLYDSGAYVTHILFGKLRVFSFYFDAGTFGAAMGQLCIITAVLFLGPFNRIHRYSFLFLAISSFYALMISGTRGALAIPGVGAIIYVILIKNTRYIITMITVMIFGFIFLKFTTIGNSNYNINRLRTAFDLEDASLNVRIENRKRLTAYLTDKPFGGGIGSAGTWGQRFTPNTCLANFPPDGLYTRIRAETGIVGYLLYLGIWTSILIFGLRVCWNIENSKYRSLATAFLAAYAGILVANYGNEVMTQYPNNFVTFILLTFIFIIDRWDKESIES